MIVTLICGALFWGAIAVVVWNAKHETEAEEVTYDDAEWWI